MAITTGLYPARMEARRVPVASRPMQLGVNNSLAHACRVVSCLLLLAMVPGCCTWQVLGNTGIMGAGWKNMEGGK
jgi:hypothetical protein